jgi:hypothetical protein
LVFASLLGFRFSGKIEVTITWSHVNAMELTSQIVWLLVLAMPVASVSWTVTHEEIFREVREYFRERSRKSEGTFARKSHYLLTCEYCFSHWVAFGLVVMTGFSVLLDDWRGYLISGLTLVWLANLYMTIYARLRLDVKRERVELEERQESDEDR